MPGLGGERGELLEQAGADPASLQLVRDGERGLRGSRVAQAVVLADRDDPLVAAGAGERADEHAALPPVGLEEMARRAPSSTARMPWKRR